MGTQERANLVAFNPMGSGQYLNLVRQRAFVEAGKSTDIQMTANQNAEEAAESEEGTEDEITAAWPLQNPNMTNTGLLWIQFWTLGTVLDFNSWERVVLPHLHLCMSLRSREDFAVGIACRKLLRAPSPTVSISPELCVIPAMSRNCWESGRGSRDGGGYTAGHMGTKEVLGPGRRQVPSR